MKVYITKYALTRGIMQATGERCEDPDLAKVVWSGSPFGRELFYGNDWHETWDSAVARAEDMRVAKIASLKRQIAKLENMTFAEEARG